MALLRQLGTRLKSLCPGSGGPVVLAAVRQGGRMAEVQVEGTDIVVALSAFEKVEALHGEVRLALAELQGAEVLDDVIRAVHGLRAPGTGVPGLLAVGTYRDRGKKLFAVVHHNTPRGVRLRFQDSEFDEVIVGCRDPEAVVAQFGHPPED